MTLEFKNACRQWHSVVKISGRAENKISQRSSLLKQEELQKNRQGRRPKINTCSYATDCRFLFIVLFIPIDTAVNVAITIVPHVIKNLSMSLFKSAIQYTIAVDNTGTMRYLGNYINEVFFCFVKIVEKKYWQDFKKAE